MNTVHPPHPDAWAHPPIYGLMAEFTDVNKLVAACRAAYQAGYRNMDAYSPFPSHELSDAIGFRRNLLPLLVLCGGIAGLLGGFGLEYWVSVVAYPLNVGGKPAFSLPAFIPVMFETTVLGAALTAVLGMLALNGLPMPYHPVFNVPEFARASSDRFFLCIESTDPRFDRDATRKFLEGLAPHAISEVEH